MKTALRYLMGLLSVVQSGSTRADQMEIDSRETDGSSVKNFPTLRAALVGGELPVPEACKLRLENHLSKML